MMYNFGIKQNAMATIEKSSLKFLKDIKKNNNREWFSDNKPRFVEANNNMKAFLSDVETELNKIDVIEKTKLFRIYRDVRFSKDKTPYSSNFRMSLTREGAHRRGGYFLMVSPGGSMIGGGFYKPEPKDLKLIRGHIASDSKPLRKIMASKKFKDTFGTLMGEQVKSAPRGIDKDHPDIDLLRYKSMYVFKEFKDSEVTSPNFTKEVIKVYKHIQPFFEYMTDILTHDLDGVPLYK